MAQLRDMTDKQYRAWERDRIAIVTELPERVVWKLADELCLGVWWANTPDEVA